MTNESNENKDMMNSTLSKLNVIKSKTSSQKIKAAKKAEETGNYWTLVESPGKHLKYPKPKSFSKPPSNKKDLTMQVHSMDNIKIMENLSA